MLDGLMNILIEFLNSIITALSSLLTFIVELLPQSPFQSFDMTWLKPYIGYLNWIIPFGRIIDTLILWLGCIACYYIYSIALRWIKAIK